MKAHNNAPPPFHWEDWYAGIGGRSPKQPEVEEYYRKIKEEQFPRFHGEVAPKRHVFHSPENAAQHLKAKAREFGADIVGICAIEPEDIYRGQEVTEHYAIALGMRMKYEAFLNVPSRESAIECMRIYHALGEVVIALADHIRTLGYTCEIEHPIGDSRLLHVPIALKAGFGELGRHGSIIHPEFGPLFRMGSVATSIPLACDAPIDAGIGAFCDSCNACRIYCPADAIPDERSPEAGKDPQGNDRYLIDTGKCLPYFNANHYCSICLPVCVYNHKDWAKDFETGEALPFPDVEMNEVPETFDGVELKNRHDYPKINRDGAGVFADRYRRKG